MTVNDESVLNSLEMRCSLSFVFKTLYVLLYQQNRTCLSFSRLNKARVDARFLKNHSQQHASKNIITINITFVWYADVRESPSCNECDKNFMCGMMMNENELVCSLKICLKWRACLRSLENL